jgi:hypothetical protein
MKISALAAMIAVLSLLATSAAEAIVPSGHGGEVRNGQAQGQSSGVHTDGGNAGANTGDVHK